MNNIDSKLYPQFNFKFDGVRDTYDKYILSKDENGDIVAIEKETGISTSEALIIDRVKFAISWVNCVSLAKGLTKDQKKMRYHYAFMQEARLTYAQIMTTINEQLKTTGNINSKQIVDNLYHIYKNAYGVDIARRLFNEKRYVNAVDKWARHAIVDALDATEPLMTLDEIDELENNRRKI